jgi:hypothetical protein
MTAVLLANQTLSPEIVYPSVAIMDFNIARSWQKIESNLQETIKSLVE